MAYAASMVWDVRTTGSDSNGGGFDPVSGTPGTDYSQQDSPQVSYTDLVIDGTTNTKCSSAGHPFTSAHVGNVINITSGTGFTVQRVQVMSVTAAVATCDKSLGTLSSTGGNGALGGGLLTVSLAYHTLFVQGNTAYIKSGTYTITAALIAPVVSGMGGKVIGYGTTHGDNGTKPVITTSTNSVHMWEWGATGYSNTLFKNLKFTNTAGTPGSCFFATGHVQFLTVVSCIIDGFNVGINGSGAGAPYDFISLIVDRTEVKNCTSHGIINSNQSIITSCFIHDNGGIGFGSSAAQANYPQTVIGTIFYKNNIGLKALTGGSNAGEHGAVFVVNCTFHTNTGEGIVSSNSETLYVYNSIFYANTTYGINLGGSSEPNANYQVVLVTNAFGAQGTANYNVGGITTAPGDVTLTADPCTAPASGDFSLNSTAGGGAACKAAGTQYS